MLCEDRTETPPVHRDIFCLHLALNKGAQVVEDMYTLFNVSDVSLAPFRVPMEINKASLEMEVDTGAAASVIREVTYKTHWKGKCNERPP